MEASKFILKVTAGATYDQQEPIEVNGPKSHVIKSEHIDARINVRIQDFRGICSLQ